MSPATVSLLVFANLACLVAAGAGSYRAYRNGVGRQRALAAIGPGLLAVGMMVVPFVGGVLTGMAARTGEPPPTSFMLWGVTAFVGAAAVVGIILWTRFPTPRR